ncbi:hypothetical protein [Pseudescherichia vulneris]|uniref:hypothetical protein n=1 Tax=Pseudescherichia vulneris TaxID=566 RepID=UPI0028D40988|nr:hypothetical protein [Pseudescherichia vulneris]
MFSVDKFIGKISTGGGTSTTIIEGSQLHVGMTDPTAAQGNNGDSFINKATKVLFAPKTSGQWPQGIDLSGTEMHFGTSDPTDSIGTDGAVYFNETTKVLFGPKANGKWGAGSSLTGNDGKTPQLRVTDLNLQASYDGQQWKTLFDLSALKPVDGRSVEFQIAGTTLQSRLVGDAQWGNLFDFAQLKGLDGKSAEMRTASGYVQWRQSGAAEWVNLFAVPKDGAPGPANKLSVGSVNKLPAGSQPAVEITGDSPNQVVNFSLVDGASVTIKPGKVTMLPAGSSMTVDLSGAYPDYLLDIGFPAPEKGDAGPANKLSVGTVSLLTAGSGPTVTITGTPPNQTISFGLPAAKDGVSPVLKIGTITTLSAGSSATAEITGTAPNFTLNVGIPQGNQGIGLTPGTAIQQSLSLETAYRATDLTKPHFLSVMIDVTYTVTLASTMSDTVEMWVGPDAAGVTSGGATAKRVASFRSALTGIAVSIGMSAGDRGQLTWLVPAGHYFALRRTAGTRATIAEAFLQPLT